MDKNDIRTVIHHRVPASYEEYLQESGRAGRDGGTADAYVVVTKADMDSDHPYSPVLEAFLPKKDGTPRGCRRRAILRAMGQEKGECTGCDLCLGQVSKDMSADRQIRRLIKRWPFRFNPMMASNLLCGLENTGIVNLEAILDPMYGSVRGWNPKELGDTIRKLSSDGSRYPLSKLSFLNRHGLDDWDRESDLLYPSTKLLYNAIASLLRRIDHGYRWIIRKTRRLGCFGKRSRGKKAD